MKMFPLTVLAADRPLYKGLCKSLILPTTQGEYGIMAGHRNMISAVVPGIIKFRIERGGLQVASVSNGIIKVENGEVLLLVGTVERPEEIDARRAQRELDEAKEAILQKKSIKDYQETRARMARALSRLKAKNYRFID